MSTRHTPRAPSLHAHPEEVIKPVAITLSSDLGDQAAANEDTRTADARRVNPLWMITAGLAVFFAFLALVATFD